MPGGTFGDALAATQSGIGVPLKVPTMLALMSEKDREAAYVALRDTTLSSRHLARAITAHLKAIGIDDSISEGAVTSWRTRNL